MTHETDKDQHSQDHVDSAEGLTDDALEAAQGGLSFRTADLIAPTGPAFGGARDSRHFYAGSEEEPMAIKPDTRQLYAGSEEEPMAIKPTGNKFLK